MMCPFTIDGKCAANIAAACICEKPGFRNVAFGCFICGADAFDSPDKEPPYRCRACFANVANNEADGELC